MNWLEESVKRSKKLKDHYMLGDVNIYIKDQLPEHIDVDFVIRYVAKHLPNHVLSNIEIIYGLQKLKVSPLLISIFSFAIRYIDVFIDEVKRVKISMRSRGYSEKGIRTLKPLAFASGALLIRGYERGERVYNSMISRGFKGALELEARQFNSSNLILLISVFSIGICIIDRFIL